MLLVVMPGARSSDALAPSSVLAPSSKNCVLRCFPAFAPF